MSIEVPHMFSTLSEALEKLPEVQKSAEKSEFWTDDHLLVRVTLSEAVYTGDTTYSIPLDNGLLIGWQEFYGRYVFSEQKKD